MSNIATNFTTSNLNNELVTTVMLNSSDNISITLSLATSSSSASSSVTNGTLDVSNIITDKITFN
jgi:hypothetical protein